MTWNLKVVNCGACVGMNIIFVTLNSLVWEMSADFDKKKKSFDQFRIFDSFDICRIIIIINVLVDSRS